MAQAKEIPLIGYAHSSWSIERRAARVGNKPAGLVDDTKATPSFSLDTSRLPAPPKGSSVVVVDSRGTMASDLDVAARIAAIAAESNVHVKGGARGAGGEESNTRSVIPSAVSQGRGIRPKVKVPKPLYRVGDLTSQDSPLVLATEMLEAKSLAVVEMLVHTMRENIGDPDQQIKGLAALGHYAAIGNETQMERRSVDPAGPSSDGPCLIAAAWQWASSSANV